LADAQEAIALFDAMCDRLVAKAPAAGDVSEWARLTTGMGVEGDGPIDCDALVADYGAFWRALAQRPHAAVTVVGTRWPPSFSSIASLFETIDVPDGAIDVGDQPPPVNLACSLDRRLRRRAILMERGPGTVHPAFAHPLPRWRSVLKEGGGSTIRHNSISGLATPDATDSPTDHVCARGGDRIVVITDDDDNNNNSQDGLSNKMPASERAFGDDLYGYAIIVAPPAAEADEDGEYAASAHLYAVCVNGAAYFVALGIVEWDQHDDANDDAQSVHIGRGDVRDDARAVDAVGQWAHLLPEFLGRLADAREVHDGPCDVDSRMGPGSGASSDADFSVLGVSRAAVAVAHDSRTQRYQDNDSVARGRADGDDDKDDDDDDDKYDDPSDFVCASGSVDGIDQLRDSLIEVASIAALPDGIVAYDPDLEMPILMTWLDRAQLRLAIDLFAAQRAAKTARVIADADAMLSLEGAAASVYRGPAFRDSLPESVAHRLAFHRWVRGCAGARDRPAYEFARGILSPFFSPSEISIDLDTDPEAGVDERRTACGQDAINDVLAAAALFDGDDAELNAVENHRLAASRQEARLLCGALAPGAIRAGVWATFGVWPLEPASLGSPASLAVLAAQRKAWRRACLGVARSDEIARLASTAKALGLPLNDEDFEHHGRLCGKLALIMAL
jgi:hypothetical protein